MQYNTLEGLPAFILQDYTTLIIKRSSQFDMTGTPLVSLVHARKVYF